MKSTNEKWTWSIEHSCNRNCSSRFEQAKSFEYSCNKPKVSNMAAANFRHECLLQFWLENSSEKTHQTGRKTLPTLTSNVLTSKLFFVFGFCLQPGRFLPQILQLKHKQIFWHKNSKRPSDQIGTNPRLLSSKPRPNSWLYELKINCPNQQEDNINKWIQWPKMIIVFHFYLETLSNLY